MYLRDVAISKKVILPKSTSEEKRVNETKRRPTFAKVSTCLFGMECLVDGFERRPSSEEETPHSVTLHTPQTMHGGKGFQLIQGTRNSTRIVQIKFDLYKYDADLF